jgi:hypothetical protein
LLVVVVVSTDKVSAGTVDRNQQLEKLSRNGTKNAEKVLLFAILGILSAPPPVSAKPSVQVPKIFQNGQRQELVVVVVVVIVVVAVFVVVLHFVVVVVIVGVIFGDVAPGAPVVLVLCKTLAFAMLGAGNVCAVADQTFFFQRRQTPPLPRDPLSFARTTTTTTKQLLVRSGRLRLGCRSDSRGRGNFGLRNLTRFQRRAQVGNIWLLQADCDWTEKTGTCAAFAATTRKLVSSDSLRPPCKKRTPGPRLLRRLLLCLFHRKADSQRCTLFLTGAGAAIVVAVVVVAGVGDAIVVVVVCNPGPLFRKGSGRDSS